MVEVLLALFAVAGLVKHWHLWNLLVSLPFFLVWRKTLGANLEAVADGRAPDHGSPRARALGIAVSAAILAFNAWFVLSAVAGWIQPVSLGKIAS